MTSTSIWWAWPNDMKEKTKHGLTFFAWNRNSSFLHFPVVRSYVFHTLTSDDVMRLVLSSRIRRPAWLSYISCLITQIHSPYTPNFPKLNMSSLYHGVPYISLLGFSGCSGRSLGKSDNIRRPYICVSQSWRHCFNEQRLVREEIWKGKTGGKVEDDTFYILISIQIKISSAQYPFQRALDPLLILSEIQIPSPIFSP